MLASQLDNDLSIVRTKSDISHLQQLSRQKDEDTKVLDQISIHLETPGIIDPVMRQQLHGFLDQIQEAIVPKKFKKAVHTFLDRGPLKLTTYEAKIASRFLFFASKPENTAKLGFSVVQTQRLQKVLNCLPQTSEQKVEWAKQAKARFQAIQNTTPIEKKYQDQMYLINPDNPALTTIIDELIGQNHISMDMSDEALANVLLRYVQTNITYQTEAHPDGLPMDHWQSVSETLKKGAGDCEDLSILLASLMMQVYERKGYSRQDIRDRVKCSAGYLEVGEQGRQGHMLVSLTTSSGKEIALDATNGEYGIPIDAYPFEKVFDWNDEFFQKYQDIDDSFITATSARHLDVDAILDRYEKEMEIIEFVLTLQNPEALRTDLLSGLNQGSHTAAFQTAYNALSQGSASAATRGSNLKLPKLDRFGDPHFEIDHNSASDVDGSHFQFNDTTYQLEPYDGAYNANEKYFEAHDGSSYDCMFFKIKVDTIGLMWEDVNFYQAEINQDVFLNYINVVQNSLNRMTVLYHIARAQTERINLAARDVHDEAYTDYEKDMLRRNRQSQDKFRGKFVQSVSSFQSKVGGSVQEVAQEYFGFIQTFNDAQYQKASLKIEQFARKFIDGDTGGGVMMDIVLGIADLLGGMAGTIVDELLGIFSTTRALAKEELGEAKTELDIANARAMTNYAKAMTQNVRLWNVDTAGKQAEVSDRSVSEHANYYGTRIWDTIRDTGTSELSSRDTFKKTHIQTILNQLESEVIELDVLSNTSVSWLFPDINVDDLEAQVDAQMESMAEQAEIEKYEKRVLEYNDWWNTEYLKVPPQMVFGPIAPGVNNWKWRDNVYPKLSPPSSEKATLKAQFEAVPDYWVDEQAVRKYNTWRDQEIADGLITYDSTKSKWVHSDPKYATYTDDADQTQYYNYVSATTVAGIPDGYTNNPPPEEGGGGADAEAMDAGQNDGLFERLFGPNIYMFVRNSVGETERGMDTGIGTSSQFYTNPGRIKTFRRAWGEVSGQAYYKSPFLDFNMEKHVMLSEYVMRFQVLVKMVFMVQNAIWDKKMQVAEEIGGKEGLSSAGAFKGAAEQALDIEIQKQSSSIEQVNSGYQQLTIGVNELIQARIDVAKAMWDQVLKPIFLALNIIVSAVATAAYSAFIASLFLIPFAPWVQYGILGTGGSIVMTLEKSMETLKEESTDEWIHPEVFQFHSRRYGDYFSHRRETQNATKQDTVSDAQHSGLYGESDYYAGFVEEKLFKTRTAYSQGWDDGGALLGTSPYLATNNPTRTNSDFDGTGSYYEAERGGEYIGVDGTTKLPYHMRVGNKLSTAPSEFILGRGDGSFTLDAAKLSERRRAMAHEMMKIKKLLGIIKAKYDAVESVIVTMFNKGKPGTASKFDGLVAANLQFQNQLSESYIQEINTYLGALNRTAGKEKAVARANIEMYNTLILLAPKIGLSWLPFPANKIATDAANLAENIAALTTENLAGPFAGAQAEDYYDEQMDRADSLQYDISSATEATLLRQLSERSGVALYNSISVWTKNEVKENDIFKTLYNSGDMRGSVEAFGIPNATLYKTVNYQTVLEAQSDISDIIAVRLFYLMIEQALYKARQNVVQAMFGVSSSAGLIDNVMSIGDDYNNAQLQALSLMAEEWGYRTEAYNTYAQAALDFGANLATSVGEFCIGLLLPPAPAPDPPPDKKKELLKKALIVEGLQLLLNIVVNISIGLMILLGSLPQTAKLQGKDGSKKTSADESVDEEALSDDKKVEGKDDKQQADSRYAGMGNNMGMGDNSIKISFRGRAVVNRSVQNKAQKLLKRRHRQLKLLREVSLARADAMSDAAAEIGGVEATKAYKGISKVMNQFERKDSMMAQTMFKSVKQRADIMNRGMDRMRSGITGILKGVAGMINARRNQKNKNKPEAISQEERIKANGKKGMVMTALAAAGSATKNGFARLGSALGRTWVGATKRAIGGFFSKMGQGIKSGWSSMGRSIQSGNNWFTKSLRATGRAFSRVRNFAKGYGESGSATGKGSKHRDRWFSMASMRRASSSVKRFFGKIGNKWGDFKEKVKDAVRVKPGDSVGKKIGKFFGKLGVGIVATANAIIKSPFKAVAIGGRFAFRLLKAILSPKTWKAGIKEALYQTLTDLLVAAFTAATQHGDLDSADQTVSKGSSDGRADEHGVGDGEDADGDGEVDDGSQLFLLSDNHGRGAGMDIGGTAELENLAMHTNLTAANLQIRQEMLQEEIKNLRAIGGQMKGVVRNQVSQAYGQKWGKKAGDKLKAKLTDPEAAKRVKAEMASTGRVSEELLKTLPVSAQLLIRGGTFIGRRLGAMLPGTMSASSIGSRESLRKAAEEMDPMQLAREITQKERAVEMQAAMHDESFLRRRMRKQGGSHFEKGTMSIASSQVGEAMTHLDDGDPLTAQLTSLQKGLQGARDDRVGSRDDFFRKSGQLQEQSEQLLETVGEEIKTLVEGGGEVDEERLKALIAVQQSVSGVVSDLSSVSDFGTQVKMANMARLGQDQETGSQHNVVSRQDISSLGSVGGDDALTEKLHRRLRSGGVFDKAGRVKVLRAGQSHDDAVQAAVGADLYAVAIAKNLGLDPTDQAQIDQIKAGINNLERNQALPAGMPAGLEDAYAEVKPGVDADIKALQKTIGMSYGERIQSLSQSLSGGRSGELAVKGAASALGELAEGAPEGVKKLLVEAKGQLSRTSQSIQSASKGSLTSFNAMILSPSKDLLKSRRGRASIEELRDVLPGGADPDDAGFVNQFQSSAQTYSELRKARGKLKRTSSRPLEVQGVGYVDTAEKAEGHMEDQVQALEKAVAVEMERSGSGADAAAVKLLQVSSQGEAGQELVAKVLERLAKRSRSMARDRASMGHMYRHADQFQSLVSAMGKQAQAHPELQSGFDKTMNVVMSRQDSKRVVSRLTKGATGAPSHVGDIWRNMSSGTMRRLTRSMSAEQKQNVVEALQEGLPDAGGADLTQDQKKSLQALSKLRSSVDPATAAAINAQLHLHGFDSADDISGRLDQLDTATSGRLSRHGVIQGRTLDAIRDELMDPANGLTEVHGGIRYLTKKGAEELSLAKDQIVEQLDAAARGEGGDGAAKDIMGLMQFTQGLGVDIDSLIAEIGQAVIDREESGSGGDPRSTENIIKKLREWAEVDPAVGARDHRVVAGSIADDIEAARTRTTRIPAMAMRETQGHLQHIAEDIAQKDKEAVEFLLEQDDKRRQLVRGLAQAMVEDHALIGDAKDVLKAVIGQLSDNQALLGLVADDLVEELERANEANTEEGQALELDDMLKEMNAEEDAEVQEFGTLLKSAAHAKQFFHADLTETMQVPEKRSKLMRSIMKNQLGKRGKTTFYKMVEANPVAAATLLSETFQLNPALGTTLLREMRSSKVRELPIAGRKRKAFFTGLLGATGQKLGAGELPANPARKREYLLNVKARATAALSGAAPMPPNASAEELREMVDLCDFYMETQDDARLSVTGDDVFQPELEMETGTGAQLHGQMVRSGSTGVDRAELQPIARTAVTEALDALDLPPAPLGGADPHAALRPLAQLLQYAQQTALGQDSLVSEMGDHDPDVAPLGDDPSQEAVAAAIDAGGAGFDDEILVDVDGDVAHQRIAKKHVLLPGRGIRQLATANAGRLTVAQRRALETAATLVDSARPHPSPTVQGDLLMQSMMSATDEELSGLLEKESPESIELMLTESTVSMAQKASVMARLCAAATTPELQEKIPIDTCIALCSSEEAGEASAQIRDILLPSQGPRTSQTKGALVQIMEARIQATMDKYGDDVSTMSPQAKTAFEADVRQYMELSRVQMERGVGGDASMSETGKKMIGAFFSDYNSSVPPGQRINTEGTVSELWTSIIDNNANLFPRGVRLAAGVTLGHMTALKELSDLEAQLAGGGDIAGMPGLARLAPDGDRPGISDASIQNRFPKLFQHMAKTDAAALLAGDARTFEAFTGDMPVAERQLLGAADGNAFVDAFAPIAGGAPAAAPPTPAQVKALHTRVFADRDSIISGASDRPGDAGAAPPIAAGTRKARVLDELRRTLHHVQTTDVAGIPNQREFAAELQSMIQELDPPFIQAFAGVSTSAATLGGRVNSGADYRDVLSDMQTQLMGLPVGSVMSESEMAAELKPTGSSQKQLTQMTSVLSKLMNGLPDGPEKSQVKAMLSEVAPALVIESLKSPEAFEDADQAAVDAAMTFVKKDMQVGGANAGLHTIMDQIRAQPGTAKKFFGQFMKAEGPNAGGALTQLLTEIGADADLQTLFFDSLPAGTRDSGFSSLSVAEKQTVFNGLFTRDPDKAIGLLSEMPAGDLTDAFFDGLRFGAPPQDIAHADTDALAYVQTQLPMSAQVKFKAYIGRPLFDAAQRGAIETSVQNLGAGGIGGNPFKAIARLKPLMGRAAVMSKHEQSIRQDTLAATNRAAANGQSVFIAAKDTALAALKDSAAREGLAFDEAQATADVTTALLNPGIRPGGMSEAEHFATVATSAAMGVFQGECGRQVRDTLTHMFEAGSPATPESKSQMIRQLCTPENAGMLNTALSAFGGGPVIESLMQFINTDPAPDIPLDSLKVLMETPRFQGAVTGLDADANEVENPKFHYLRAMQPRGAGDPPVLQGLNRGAMKAVIETAIEEGTLDKCELGRMPDGDADLNGLIEGAFTNPVGANALSRDTAMQALSKFSDRPAFISARLTAARGAQPAGAFVRQTIGSPKFLQGAKNRAALMHQILDGPLTATPADVADLMTLYDEQADGTRLVSGMPSETQSVLSQILVNSDHVTAQNRIDIISCQGQVPELTDAAMTDIRNTLSPAAPVDAAAAAARDALAESLQELAVAEPSLYSQFIGAISDGPGRPGGLPAIPYGDGPGQISRHAPDGVRIFTGAAGQTDASAAGALATGRLTQDIRQILSPDGHLDPANEDQAMRDMSAALDSPGAHQDLLSGLHRALVLGQGNPNPRLLGMLTAGSPTGCLLARILADPPSPQAKINAQKIVNHLFGETLSNPPQVGGHIDMDAMLSRFQTLSPHLTADQKAAFFETLSAQDLTQADIRSIQSSTIPHDMKKEVLTNLMGDNKQTLEMLDTLKPGAGATTLDRELFTDLLADAMQNKTDAFHTERGEELLEDLLQASIDDDMETLPLMKALAKRIPEGQTAARNLITGTMKDLYLKKDRTVGFGESPKARMRRVLFKGLSQAEPGSSMQSLMLDSLADFARVTDYGTSDALLWDTSLKEKHLIFEEFVKAGPETVGLLASSHPDLVLPQTDSPVEKRAALKRNPQQYLFGYLEAQHKKDPTSPGGQAFQSLLEQPGNQEFSDSRLKPDALAKEILTGAPDRRSSLLSKLLQKKPGKTQFTADQAVEKQQAKKVLTAVIKEAKSNPAENRALLMDVYNQDPTLFYEVLTDMSDSLTARGTRSEMKSLCLELGVPTKARFDEVRQTLHSAVTGDGAGQAPAESDEALLGQLQARHMNPTEMLLATTHLEKQFPGNPKFKDLGKRMLQEMLREARVAPGDTNQDLPGVLLKQLVTTEDAGGRLHARTRTILSAQDGDALGLKEEDEKRLDGQLHTALHLAQKMGVLTEGAAVTAPGRGEHQIDGRVAPSGRFKRGPRANSVPPIIRKVLDRATRMRGSQMPLAVGEAVLHPGDAMEGFLGRYGIVEVE